MRAPHTTRPRLGNDAQAVDADRVDQAVLVVGELHGELLGTRDRGVHAGGRLPDAAVDVGARHDAGDGAARHEHIHLAAAQRVALAQAREVQRRVGGIGEREHRLGRVELLGLHLGRGVARDWRPNGRGRIDDQECPPIGAKLGRLLAHRLVEGAAAGVGWDAEQVEDIGLQERVDARSSWLRRR